MNSYKFQRRLLPNRSKVNPFLDTLRNSAFLQYKYALCLIDGTIDRLVERGKLYNFEKEIIEDTLRTGVGLLRHIPEEGEELNEEGYCKEEWEAMYPRGDGVYDCESHIRYCDAMYAILDEESAIEQEEYERRVKEEYENDRPNRQILANKALDKWISTYKSDTK